MSDKLCRGERHHSSKLTANKVLAIRFEYIPGVMGYDRLAKKYNCDRMNICRIVKGLIWKGAE